MAPRAARLVVRWTARLGALLSIATLSTFIVGEEGGLTAMTPSELIAFLLFPVGVVAGLILGWWREALGAAVALGSLALFYAVILIGCGSFPGGPWFLIFSSPAVLYALSAALSRTPPAST